MSLLIDKKFIGLVSPMLDKFKWKKENLANFRCPLCGDSGKSKSKARGYLFAKKNDMFFCCHNCGASHTLYRFLEIVSPSLCKQYSLDRWKEGETGHSNYKKPEFVFEKPVFRKDMGTAQRLDTLEENHMCVAYVRTRKIPESAYPRLYYVENFDAWLKEIDPTATSVPKDKRLIIPIFNAKGGLIGVQGRTLEDHHLRYITIKLDKDVERLWYGLEQEFNSETIFVVEGPLDSLFIPNCVAMVGINDTGCIPKAIRGRKIIFAIDNEPRNDAVVNRMQNMIDAKRDIVVWPETIKEKDINDMVLAGHTPIELVDIMKTNSCNGLEAKLKLNTWKKV
jgi:transcription elongation factor Elf1